MLNLYTEIKQHPDGRLLAFTAKHEDVFKARDIVQRSVSEYFAKLERGENPDADRYSLREGYKLVEQQCPGCRGLKQISGVDCALCEGAGTVWVEVPV